MTAARFLRWADRLMERIPRHDWPDLTGEWWEGVREFMGHLSPTDEELTRILASLQRTPPKFLDGLIPLIDQEIRAIRTPVSGPMGAETDRKLVEAESRACPECSGCGIASREHERAGYWRYTASYYCHRCPMGRWLKTAHESKPDGPRLADLGDHPNLWTRSEDLVDPEMVRLFQLRQVRAREAAARRNEFGNRRRAEPVAAF